MAAQSLTTCSTCSNPLSRTLGSELSNSALYGNSNEAATEDTLSALASERACILGTSKNAGLISSQRKPKASMSAMTLSAEAVKAHTQHDKYISLEFRLLCFRWQLIFGLITSAGQQGL